MATNKKIWSWVEKQSSEFQDWAFPTHSADFWRIMNVVAAGNWLEESTFRRIARTVGISIGKDAISVREYIYFVFCSPTHFWHKKQHVEWFKILQSFVDGNITLLDLVITELEAQLLAQKINYMPSWVERQGFWNPKKWIPIAFTDTTALEDLRKKLRIKPISDAEFTILEREWGKTLSQRKYEPLKVQWDLFKPSKQALRFVFRKILVELRKVNHQTNTILSNTETLTIGYWANYFKLVHVESLEELMQKKWGAIVQSTKKAVWNTYPDLCRQTYVMIIQLSEVIAQCQKTGSA